MKQGMDSLEKVDCQRLRSLAKSEPNLLNRSSAVSQVRLGKTPGLTLSTFVPSRIAVVTCSRTVSSAQRGRPHLERRAHLLGDGSRELKAVQLCLEWCGSNGQRCYPTRDPRFHNVAQVGLIRGEARVTQAELGVFDCTLPLEAC